MSGWNCPRVVHKINAVAGSSPHDEDENVDIRCRWEWRTYGDAKLGDNGYVAENTWHPYLQGSSPIPLPSHVLYKCKYRTSPHCHSTTQRQGHLYYRALVLSSYTQPNEDSLRVSEQHHPPYSHSGRGVFLKCSVWDADRRACGSSSFLHGHESYYHGDRAEPIVNWFWFLTLLFVLPLLFFTTLFLFVVCSASSHWLFRVL